MKLYKATSIMSAILVLSLIPVSIGASNELETDFPINVSIEETKAKKINSISNDEVECYNDETTVEEQIVSVNKVFAMNSIMPKIMSYDNTTIIGTKVQAAEINETNEIEAEETKEESSSIKEDISRASEGTETEEIKDDSKLDEPENDKGENEEEEVLLAEAEEESDEANEEYSETSYISSSKAEILSEPDKESDVIDTVEYKEEVTYEKIDNDWVAVETEDGDTGYIHIDDLDEEQVSTEKVVPISGDKRKSYESYTSLTDKKSKQYQLQQVATTGEDGGRMIDGRYLVATGSGITHEIGKYIDVTLANGKVIPCVVGDAKQNIHTNANNTIGLDGGAIEFIVDQSAISYDVKKQGNMELSNEGWDSKVVSVEVLDKSY